MLILPAFILLTKIIGFLTALKTVPWLDHKIFLIFLDVFIYVDLRNVSIFKIKWNFSLFIDSLRICFSKLEFGWDSAHLCWFLRSISNIIWAVQPYFLEIWVMFGHHYQLIPIRVFKWQSFIKVESISLALPTWVELPVDEMSCVTSRIVVSLAKRVIRRSSVQFYLEVGRIVIPTKAILHILKVLPVLLNFVVKLLLKFIWFLALKVECWFQAALSKLDTLIVCLVIVLITKNIRESFHYEI